MKIREAADILKALGWKTGSDEVGDRYAHFMLPDRVADIIYGLDRIRDQQKLGIMLSVTSSDFSEVCSKIHKERTSYWPLIVDWNFPDIRAPEILEEHVRQASSKAIAWATEQDLDKALREKAALPTDSAGTGPLLHLTALVLRGDIDRLKYYQARFEAGDRLDFVPYITKDYIDRAVTLAEERATAC